MHVQIKYNKIKKFIFPLKERNTEFDSLLEIVKLLKNVILLLLHLYKHYLPAQKS